MHAVNGSLQMVVRTSCCFFFTIYMLKSLFCEDISVEYELKSEKFKGGIDRLKLNNLDLSGNTTEFKTLPTCLRTYQYIY